MLHKLSNTASSSLLEKEFNRLVKYPHLHREQVLIDGLEESTLPIIAIEEKQYIIPAIWGILPEDYSDDWYVFQNIFRSLNLNIDSLNNSSWLSDALLQRRCLIPVTGFFISCPFDGVSYPYYFHLLSGLPFCLAGIYNKTEDGFLTCAIITSSSGSGLNNVRNANGNLPILLSKDLHSSWLCEGIKKHEIHDLLHSVPDFQLMARPISMEFFNNKIPYNSILAPIFYDPVPKQIRSEQDFYILSVLKTS